MHKDIKSHPLSLSIFPDGVLRQMCEPVERFDSELEDLVHEMLVLMRANSGIGLAAPQVGVRKRLFVCKLEGRTLCAINPQLKQNKGTAEMIEGCLSLPGVQVKVARNKKLLLRGYDVQGRRTRFKLSGLWARVAQHEVDHLNGVLICDYGEDLGLDTKVEELEL
jgi:peptide deformylase